MWPTLLRGWPLFCITNPMNAKRLIIISAVFVLFFSACATKLPFNASLPIIRIEEADQSDIRQFGSDFTVNPYMEPVTMFRGKLYEFFIVKVSFNLSTDSQISIAAKAVSPDGKEVAKVYDQYTFAEFWDANTSGESNLSAKITRKTSSISRSCIPSFKFFQRAGQSEIFIPLVSKNPILRPAIITIEVVPSTGSTMTYTYNLE